MSTPMIDSYGSHPIGLQHPRRGQQPIPPAFSRVSQQLPMQHQPPQSLSPRYSSFQFQQSQPQPQPQHNPHPHPHPQPHLQHSTSTSASASASNNSLHNRKSQLPMQAQPLYNPGQIYSSPTSTMATQPSYGTQPQRNHSGRTASTSSSSTQIRRSSSSRSASSLSYVALLRKQKATVWCDRSQAEDPRILAAQRLAKERAEREVALIPGQTGGAGIKNRTPPSSTAGSFTTSAVRKIRHHGVSKAAPYAGGNMAGAGVPMRLSASEVDDEDEEDTAQDKLEDDWAAADAAFYSGRSASAVAAASAAHRRSSSGRSSQGRGAHSRSPSEMNAVEEETPHASEFPHRTKGSGDYFTANKTASGKDSEDSSPEDEGAREKREKKEDDLVRRGSVDERAMTMSGVRLFVANPDLDD